VRRRRRGGGCLGKGVQGDVCNRREMHSIEHFVTPWWAAGLLLRLRWGEAGQKYWGEISSGTFACRPWLLAGCVIGNMEMWAVGLVTVDVGSQSGYRRCGAADTV